MKPSIIWTTETDGDEVVMYVTSVAKYTPAEARQLAASLLLAAEAADNATGEGIDPGTVLS